ncbi:mucin-2 isoform X2 [Gadus morhua]|uniref:mucin-2 isoform X2 n=1 Tax=Gadus morhua TaxID=8049 RepID=UPI0011B707C9|nr:mucin-2-like isoform X2 [Gadus morhua]
MTWSHFWLCFLALSVPNIANVQARQALNHVNSICSTWGRHHFKTFDGDVYQFPGLCGYNLVSDCHEMYREFSVHIQKSLVDGHPAVNELVVTINDLVFHLTKRNVSLNGDHINLPYLNAGIQLERNAVYTKLQAKVGLVVMWNGDDAVMVELDSDYHNRTCGLCGDFNGVPVYNEFNHHNRKIHPIEFGNGQRVHRPNDECEDPYEEEEQELDAQDLEYPELEDQAVEIPCKEFRPICEKVIYSEAWSSCASLVDPAPYTQACVQDMCGCGNSTNDFCVCSTLAEFSRQCSHAGGQPPSWRTPQFCAKMCPFNMVYEESGSPCMASCTVSDISSLCEDHKMDGCFCPAGTVWDNISQRGCVSQTECQCKHDKIYNSGEVYRQDSKECLCYQGRWDCKSLPSPATCAVEEGSHVTTFDGKAYIFHGNCHYVLAKIESKDDTSPKFTIFVQLVPCVNQEFDTCLKSVKVLLNNDKNNMLAFSADGKVRHNMQIISLPYNTGDINIFQASSFHILLQTRFGLQIQVQHVPLLQVYVTLEQRYKTKTRGLCGNYNMMLSDDMKTPQGIVEGTASSFGNSWKSSSTCPERDERLESPCSVSVENERYAEHWCSMLTRPDGPFTNCHAMVDPELYHKRCIYATCNCEKTEDCMCAVFSSYARACASKGVFLSDWRVNVCDKYTRGCPESQSFSYKLQRCQWTCRQLSSEQQSCTSDFLPVDGCSCPEGTYQEEHGACVPMNKCPCYHNGVHIKPGKSISIKEQHCLCSNGKLHCRTWKTSSQACPTPKVYLNCSSTDVRDLGVQCARTCRNTEIDSCYLTECESGCQCPSGLLDDGKGSCVKEHECPCQHDHTLYASGSEIKDQCNTCTCRKGNWECTEKKCPGTCIIYGSGHYRTFDQRTYGFQGQCAYVAIQNKCGNKSVEDIFRVITENIPCGTTGTTCSKSVRIQLGNKEIKLAKGKYEVSDLAMGSEIKYTIRPVGMYLAVEASLGITVLWDRKTTIRILLEPQHSAGVCGLCGDFNGDVQNDFTTQSQMVVSSPLEFANSWKALSSCLDAEASADSCVLQPHRHNWAQIQCSIIRSVTFQDCHKKVNPIPFYENCVKDSCACDSGGDCECFCTAVAAYAQACNEVSVCVAWRTPEICPVFCDYYNEGELCEWHYKPCHEPCYETCRNPHGCNNSIPNLEGCYPVCPEDKPIFDEDKGICVESCDGCIYNGTYYNDNDVIYNVTDNLGMCYYAICKNGKVIETNDPCPTPKPSTTTTPFITSTTTPTSSPATTPRPTTPLVTTKETTTQEPTPTPVDTTSTNTPQTTMTSSSTTEPTTPEVTTRETTSPPVSTTTPPTPSVISTTTLTTTTTAPPSTTVATPTPVVTTTTTPTQETTSVTTTPSTTTEGTTGIPSTTPCEEECEWTQWFDVDSSTDGSDWETYENITNSGEKICQKPRNISCRSTKAPDKSFDDFVKETGQVVSCDINYGLICKKKDQVSRPYKCFNYQIKVVCCVPCIPPPTPPTTSTTVITSSPNPTPGGTTSEQPTPVFSTTISTTTAPPSTPVATPTPVVTTSPTTPQSTRSTTTEPTTTPTTTSTTTAPTSTPVATPTPVVTTSTTTPKTTTTSSSTTEPTTTPTTTSTTTAPPSTPVVTPTPVVTTSTTTPKTTTTSSSTTEPTTTPTTTSTTTAPPSTPVVTPTPVVTTSTTTPKTTTTSSSTTEPTTTPTTTSTTTAPPSTPVVTPTPVVTTSTITPKTTTTSSSTTEPTTTPTTTSTTTAPPSTPVVTPTPVVTTSTTTPKTTTTSSSTTEPTTTPTTTSTTTAPPSTPVVTPTPVVTTSTITPKTTTTSSSTTEPTTTPTTTSTTTAPPSTPVVTPTPVVTASTTTPKTTTTSSSTNEPTTTPTTTSTTTAPPSTPVVTPTPVVTTSTTTPKTTTTSSSTTEPTTTPTTTSTTTAPPSTPVVTPTPVVTTSTTTPKTTTTSSSTNEPTTTPTTTSTTTAPPSTPVVTQTPVVTASTTTPKTTTTSSSTNEPTTTPTTTSTTTAPPSTPVVTPTPVVTTSTTTPKTTTTSSSTTEPTTTPTTTSTTTAPPSTPVVTPTPVVTTSTTTPKTTTTSSSTNEPTTTPTTTSTTTAPPSTPVVTPTPVVTTSTTTPKTTTTSSSTTEPTTTPTTTSTTTAPPSTPVVTPTPVVTTSTTTPKTTTTSSSTNEPTTTPTTTSTTTAPPSTPVVTPTPVVTTSTTTPKTTTTSSSTTEPTTTPTTTSTTTAPPSTPVVTPTPVVTTSTTTPKTTTTSSSTTEPTTTPTTTSTTTAPPSTPVVTPTPVVTTSTTTPKTTAISSSTTEPTATVVTTTETTSAPVSTTTPPTPTVISTTTSTTTPTVPPSTTVATSTPVITSPTTPLTTRETTSPPVSTTTPPTPTVISTTTSTTTPTVPPSTTVVTSTPVFTSPTTPQTTTTRSTLTEPTTTPTVISTTISTTTASSSTTVETLTPVTTVTKPHHSTTTPITTSSTTNESIVTGIVTTTTGPSTAPVGLPSASSTTETTYTVVLSTTTVKIPTTTTGCVCIVDGKHYKPGETIYDRKDIGSGICLSMICSAICELQNQTEPCHSTPSSTPSPPPPPPTCPEWDVTQNETFVLCDCIMAKCIENTTIEIVPYVCPPLEEIPCASGKKPVLIDDEYGCCKYYTCPCECEGWGDPHYITFDGVFYSYQGNCTYVLMEEITPKHNLKVIVDNVYCEPTEDVSCPRSIIVSYNSQVITLKNHNLMGAAKMEVLSSGETVKVPYYHQGIKVLSTGMSLILEIPTLQVVITFGITGFSISLPPREFVNNTMGHCGTCNNNKADDCMLPGGQLIQNCEVMADFYLVEDLYKPSCHVPSVKPTDSPLPPLPLTTCKPDSVCGVLLGSLFKACHAIVSPDKFYQGCIFDSCHVANPVVQCTSLQVYAASCAQAGVCLYWRNHTTLCPSNCPADKVYKPCGPAEQQTCEDKPGENQMNFTTEGCFCPDGMKLFNKESNICVDKCGCLDSEGVPREFNEIFDQNCQTCICEDSTKSVTCKPKDCPAIPAGSCTKPGFILVNQTHPADRCCLHYVCQCDSSTCPVGDLSCNVGYIPEVSVPMGHCCPVRHCLPKAVCVHKGMEYQVGSPVPVVKCQNCTCSRQVIEDSGLLEITCKMLACDQNCGLGYKYVSDKGLEECCGRCLQTHCVVDRNITQELLKEGETWSPPGNMCEFYTCVKIGETLTTIMSTTVCPHFQQSNCYPDTVQTAANGCCKICVEMDKGCKRGSMRQRITHNRCQAREDVDMPYCEGSCNTFARYEEMAAGLEHTCAGCWESRFSNRTVELECLNGDLVPYTYVHVEECSCGNTNCNRAARLPARKRRANIGV